MRFSFSPQYFLMSKNRVCLTGLCVATLGIAVLIRILTTYLMVCFAGFNIKEKIFISFAWLPKATVQVMMDSLTPISV